VYYDPKIKEYSYFAPKKMRWNIGSVAEWSMALVLGTSLCGGKGSNPFTIKVKTTFLNQSHQISNDNG
jgi:hypothetical protein